MKICGIVCEYNPFHNGHIHHINQTRQLTNCDVLIAVMSGNFVQRGEPAIVSKYQRTKAALAHGVDLVIELPFIYATQSAEYFAKASMHLLQLAGCSCFCFGSESNDLITLQKLAKLESPILDKQTSTVSSYEKHHGLLHANDILGINYLKYCGKMQPFCIQRSNLYFDEHLQDHISSATSIRKALQHHQDVAHTTPMEIKHPIFLHDYYPMLQMLLSTLSAEYLHSLFLMDEGIEHLLIKNAQLFSFEEFIQHSISKKYTQSRIQRTCIHLLNQTTKAQANQLKLPQYVRILGATATGRKYLKSIPCQTASRFNQIPDPYRQMEMKAAIVYASGFDEQMRKAIKESELQFPLFL